jgi:hypothetical protein
MLALFFLPGSSLAPGPELGTGIGTDLSARHRI